METVEAGNMLYQPDTWKDGRPCVRVLKRAGRGRSRFAPTEGTLVPIKTIVYRTVEDRDKALTDRQAAHDDWNRQKALRRAEQSKPHSYKVGDILYASWGYDQTNIDFYVVTRTTANMVWIRAIKQQSRDGEAWATGTCLPATPIEPVGEEEKHRVSGDHGVRLTSYSWATMWDGKPKHWTAYA